MFSKLLIANRGEIACRIVRSARSMGIRTVAVYSEADAMSRHVRLADEAVLIGPPPASESYLLIEGIIEAAKKTGVEAIHPGYGFLAENPALAEACARASLVFIGPPATAIRAMGSKSLAKEIMERARVPLVPGYHGEMQEPGFLHAEAARIGYPLLIKATSGGGGKGMRTVERPEDFLAALESCRREAHASFGDDRVLLEQYIVPSRHVEVQIFADGLGNAVHIFERDCSVQRRHQKVLEEAPAPGITREQRRLMGEAALAAARAVGYVGAGTVEFIVDRSGAFWFMEMNTRLQVEHPVTEMITGLDLVEWQLRVAAGEPLPLKQEELTLNGHALEARVYAEDPAKGFLPSAGRLAYLALPEQSLHLRVDSGVDQGDEITPYYDPLIAKLIVWDSDRERARARMLQALVECRIVGVANNAEFLSRLVACPAFAVADLDTGLIDRERTFLFPHEVEVPSQVYLVAALATLLREDERARAEAEGGEDRYSPWHLPNGWRLNSRSERKLVFRCGEAEKTVRVGYCDGVYELELDGQRTRAHGRLGANAAIRVDLDGIRMNATVVVVDEKRHVFLRGRVWQLARIDPLYRSTEGGGQEGSMVAPMPGKVIALLSQPGVHVEQGTPLLILEAMKMEHTIVAPSAGVLKAFRFSVGDQVSEGAELVEFEARVTNPKSVDTFRELS